MKKKFIAIIAGIIIFMSLIMFIILSNDHVECGSATKYSVGENGEKISTTTHVCKEKFSF